MSKVTVGWREWASLPELNIPAIKVKIDTGARTSALHAFMVEEFQENKLIKVRFGMHPIRNRPDIERTCVADVIDRRVISDSGGHREMRYVIQTPIRMGNQAWPIEVTLTNRETMNFRMLLGRTAMTPRLLVDPSSSYLMGTYYSEDAYKEEL
ncbi:MAG: RimK/LysX family protein [Chloroflexota bacterium]